jgi:photosystem II stability/assembly factor-like uncharacterized protein
MKKTGLLVVVFLQCIHLLAQDADARYELLGTKFPKNNYYEIVTQLDHYWANNPARFDKGSGFKVYQRWKEYWKYYLNSDSSLMTTEQIVAQYKQVYRKPVLIGMPNAKTTGGDLSNWMPWGPFTHKNKGSWSSGQGRVNAICVDPNNPNTIYIGSPNGGVWRSKNHGATWLPLSDFLPSIGVSGIAVDPSNANVIYISTGDEDGSNAYTNGIYKSIDAGATWTQLSCPFTSLSYLGELLINPINPKTLWVVGSTGLYKSVDAGLNWTQKTTVACKELRMKPNDTNTLYLVQKSSAGCALLKSTSAGETFSSIQTYSGASRVVIDVTKADSNYLYVLVANGDNSFKGIYRSVDAGLSFTAQNTLTDIFSNNGYSSRQAYYDLALAVSDTNPDIIFTGCLDVWKSTNGGVDIKRLNNWSKPDTASYTHADVHDLRFYNHNLYACTDGGIYISADLGDTFVDKTINGLNISQFYRLDVAQSDTTQIVGGLQDNGGYTYANNIWVNFHGADGMDAAINPAAPNLHYGFIQYGSSLYMHRINDTTKGRYVARSPIGENGDWITPLECGNGGMLYAGYKKLYFLYNDSFYQASPYVFSSNIKQIRVHPSNDFKVLVTDGAKLYLSDGTTTFNFKALSTLPLSSIKNFDFNRNNPAIIYAIGDLGVFKSIDEGTSWVNITYSLPIASRNAIVHQASSTNNTLYLATNKGVYYIDDSLTDWQLYNNNIPNTTITDIEVNNVENHVLVSTYGRGIWRSAVVPSSLAINEPKLNSAAIQLYPNPVMQAAQINININEPTTVRIYQSNGQLITQQEYPFINAQTTIDCSALASGVYFMTLSSAQHLVAKKFLKQ